MPHDLEEDDMSVFPLTDIQQAYLVGRERLFEYGGVGIHFYFEVSGNLDYEKLNAAWQVTVDRHIMLRTHALDSASQKTLNSNVAEEEAYGIKFLDCSGNSVDEVEDIKNGVANELREKVYDPLCSPLFDIVFIKTLHGDSVFISVDAINIDLNSFITVFDTWTRSYRGETLEELPEYNYQDYVQDLKKAHKTEAYKKAQEYWKQRLRALPSAPDMQGLVGLENFGDENYFIFERFSENIKKDVWENIKKQGAKKGLTSSVLLLSAYAESIGQYCREQKFTINVTIFNRYHFNDEVDKVEGDFTSMIFVEYDKGLETFNERCSYVQSQILESLELEFGAGPEALRNYRQHMPEKAYSALFPVVFTSALSLPGDQEGLYGVLKRLGSIDYAITQTPQLSLDYQAHEDNGDLKVIWDYRKSEFDEPTLKDVFDIYIGLLESICFDNDVFESRHPVRKVFAKHDPLIIANCGPQEDTIRESIGVVFEKTQCLFKDLYAIKSTENMYSFHQLSERVKTLASLFVESNVAEGDIVCVLMGRSFDQIAASIATVYIGAVLVPLNINDPVSRNEKIIELSDSHLVVTNGYTFKNSRLDALRIDVATLETRADIEIKPWQGDVHNPCYMIFTSGTTGSPKGVSISHYSLVNRMKSVIDMYHINSTDTAIALTAMNHDLAVFDVFGVLCMAGGSLALLDEVGFKNPSYWLELIYKFEVTIWNSVPQFPSMLLESIGDVDIDDAIKFSTLRLMVLSGDFIPVDIPSKLSMLNSTMKVYGSGGPTENTVWDIYYPIGEESFNKRIPYGYPLPNTQYFVMNERLCELPRNVVGQLCVAGIGLAIGYFKDEERTNERFTMHPLTGQTIYLTGDSGYLDHLGRVIITGRTDRQKNISGRRVDLNEVENALLSLEKVCRACVIQDDKSGRLNAAVMAESEDFYQVPGATIATSAEKTAFKLDLHSHRKDLESNRKIQLLGQAGGDLTSRKTIRSFQETPPLRGQLDGLLSQLCSGNSKDTAFPKYSFGSAGGLYPVQVYITLLCDVDDEFNAGAYYLDQLSKRLIKIGPCHKPLSFEHTRDNSVIIGQAAGTIDMVYTPQAIKPVYGDISRDFAFLEAGYIGQLITSSSLFFGIGTCPIGAFDDKNMSESYGLDNGQEIIHSMAFGVPSTEDTKRPNNLSGLDEDIKHKLSKMLPNEAIPSRVIEVDSIPLTRNGKTDYEAISKYFLDGDLKINSSKEEKDKCEKSSSITDNIIAEMEMITGVQGIPKDKSLSSLGLDSISLVRLHRQIQHLFEVEVPIEVMFGADSALQLAECIAEYTE